MKKLLLGIFALMVAGWTQAAGVFLPVDAMVGRAGVTAHAAGVSRQAAGYTWERRVRVDRSALERARHEVEHAGGGRLLLNVRAGAELDVRVDRSAATAWGYSLSGRIGVGSVGFVTLVVHDEAVAGSIWLPHASYEIGYLSDGVHALRDVTNRRPFECKTALPPSLAVPDWNARSTAEALSADVAVVDILALWNAIYVDVSGLSDGPYEEKKAGIRAVIDLAIASTNDAFERSGAFISLNLAGAVPVEYPQGGSIWEQLMMLADPSDGHMDDVHALRDLVGADLVYLFTPTRGGQSYGEYNVGMPQVFAHEIGHAMGVSHERFDNPEIGGIGGAGHGFTLFSGRSCYASIVAIGAGCWGERRAEKILRDFTGRTLPFYSSPRRYLPVDGSPLGVSWFSKERGVRGPADAVTTLNRNRHLMANIRRSRAPGSQGLRRE